MKQQFKFLFGMTMAFILMGMCGPLRAQAQTESRALIISRGDYGSASLNLTPGPENDAKNFSRVLKRAYGEKMEITLKERDGVTTVSGVTQAIRENFADSSDENVNYFYYTGHGTKSGLYLGAETMSASQLAQAFAGISGTHILVIDCCYAGSMISRSADSGESFLGLFIQEFEQAAAAMKKSRSALTTGEFHVITAASSEEESWQGELGEDGADIGLFSGSMGYGCGILPCRVNQEEGYVQEAFPADYNQDGKISFDEIYLFIQNQVYSSNVRRYPQYDEGQFLPADRSNTMEAAVNKAAISYSEDGEPILSLSYQAKEEGQIAFALYKGELWDLSCLMRYCADLSLPVTKKPAKVGEGICEIGKGTGSAKIKLKDFGREFGSGNYAVMVRSQNGSYSYLLPFVLQEEGETVLLDAFDLTSEAGEFCIDGKKELCITADFGTGRREDLVRPYMTAVIRDEQGNMIRNLGEDVLADAVYVKTGSYKFYRKFYWDGKDKEGKEAGAGTYQVEVEARQGAAASLKTVSVRVTGAGNPDEKETEPVETEQAQSETTETKPETETPQTEPLSPPEVKASSIQLKVNGKKLSGKKVAIGRKEKITLKAVLKPSDAVQKKVKYQSSNKKIATVSSKGVVQGKKAGTARITISEAGGVKFVLKVRVKKAPHMVSTGIQKKTLKKGARFRVKAKLPKGSASYKLTYASSRPKVAAVGSDGRVTAKRKGKAIITVKTYNGKRARIFIRIK